MEDIDLYTTKETRLTVQGNMLNCGFSGQNLHASDVSSITVAGSIINSPLYTFALLPPPSRVPIRASLRMGFNI